MVTRLNIDTIRRVSDPDSEAETTIQAKSGRRGASERLTSGYRSR